MSTPLRVVIIADRLVEVEDLLHPLRAAGFDPAWQRVAQEHEYLAHLDPAPDLVLADVAAPQCPPLRALDHLRERGLDLPFIVVSGAVSETLVACLKRGAADYVLRNRLDQLGQVVREACADRERRHQQRQAEAALRESEARFRDLVENTSDILWQVDQHGVYTYCSPNVTRILGYAPEEVLGRTPFDFMPPEDAQRMRDLFASLAAERKPFALVPHRIFHKDGSLMVMECSGQPVCDAAGVLQGFRGVDRDITARKRVEELLEHQVLHDALTGLPNRTLLQDRLQQAILDASRSHASLAVLLLRFDGIRDVNDTFGHQAGDDLLQQVGDRLHSALWEADTVARLGGVEFAVVLPTAGDVAGVILVVRRLLRVLEAPFTVSGLPLHVRTSIGIARAPEHGTHAETLLRNAAVAMHVARRSGNGYAIYSAAQDEYSPDRLALIGELHQAIRQNQLVLHYQPQVDLVTGSIAWVEALVRWQHPQRGLVPPGQFIPLAEQTGLIQPLTRWVLGAALHQAAAWQRAGLRLGVAVNLSARDPQDEQLPDYIARMLEQWGVAPTRLKVEMTESSLMADPAQALETLRRLRAMGIEIAIDDFGTGYSSLAYLRRLPVSELKIDKSFVLDMALDEGNAAIVRLTIELGHYLGLKVVAEGVESRQAWELLAALGCDAAQGYYVSHPVPAADLVRRLHSLPWNAFYSA
ncbi:MAG: EAL domain-containing protein [Chloroflexi bacterium]|nr:EAL domain-containing protein [Chloroflexota bacterium]